MQNYELIEKIGQGGMGHVWRARHTGLDRNVAIKFMDAMFAQDPIANERFMREARLLAKIDHPNVVRVYDMGVDEKNQPFIAMELLQGIELAEQLKKGPLSEADAVQVASQVLLALEESHRHGITHRDIKSSNIMLLPNRTVKLLDFGIARDAMLSNVTSTGKVIGTPAYMSPEQAEGMPASQQSDLYSVGIVMYEMLMGLLPFRGETPLSVLRKQADEPAPKLPDVFSPHIRSTVAKALEKRIESRFRTAREMFDSLNALPASSAAASRVANSIPSNAGQTSPGGPPPLTPQPQSVSYPNSNMNPGSSSGSDTLISWISGAIGLVCAIACAPIGFVSSIMGLIFGIRGKKRMQRSALGAILLSSTALLASIGMGVFLAMTALPVAMEAVPTMTVETKAAAYAKIHAGNESDKTSELGALSLVGKMSPAALLTRQKVLDAKASYESAYAVEKRIDDLEDAQIRQLLAEMRTDAGSATSAQAALAEFKDAIGDPDESGSRTHKLHSLRDEYYTAVSDYLKILLKMDGKYTLAPGGAMFQFEYGTEASDVDEFNRLTETINKVYQQRVQLETERNEAVAELESTNFAD